MSFNRSFWPDCFINKAIYTCWFAFIFFFYSRLVKILRQLENMVHHMKTTTLFSQRTSNINIGLLYRSIIMKPSPIRLFTLEWIPVYLHQYPVKHAIFNQINSPLFSFFLTDSWYSREKKTGIKSWISWKKKRDNDKIGETKKNLCVPLSLLFLLSYYASHLRHMHKVCAKIRHLQKTL